MLRFILRRLAIIPIALLAVHFLGFTYAHYARPIRARRTPYLAYLPESQALIPTYITYIESLFNQDFGIMPTIPEGSRSEAETASLMESMKRATVNSLGLIAIALTLSVIIGLTMGFAAAKSEPPRVAQWLTPVSTVGLAMPSFYIGSLFVVASVMYIISAGKASGGVAIAPPIPFQGFGWDLHLVFPVLALMARPTVQIAQVTANLITEELSKQYIVAARAIGHSWRTVRWRHAMRNVLAPIVLTIASAFRILMGELILVEWLFRWPGLGRLLAWTLVPALLSNSSGSPLFLDPPVVSAILTVIAAFFMLSDLISSILVRLFDPRLRTPVETSNG